VSDRTSLKLGPATLVHFFIGNHREKSAKLRGRAECRGWRNTHTAHSMIRSTLRTRPLHGPATLVARQSEALAYWLLLFRMSLTSHTWWLSCCSLGDWRVSHPDALHGGSAATRAPHKQHSMPTAIAMLNLSFTQGAIILLWVVLIAYTTRAYGKFYYTGRIIHYHFPRKYVPVEHAAPTSVLPSRTLTCTIMPSTLPQHHTFS